LQSEQDKEQIAEPEPKEENQQLPPLTEPTKFEQENHEH
jgi:hypothetical protein